MAPLMGGCFWLWWQLKQQCQQQQQHQRHQNMATDYGIQQWFVFHSTKILVRQKGFITELQFLPVTMLFLFS
ncbi:hypothetical protein JHK82_046815 [Glycine max]|uniref:Uncharacterized protein n=2 Tax=Glycine subgen. Soja TaxID=1462606 RepID=C6SVV9_SOYBN|nr:unknown [Glycine max]KAG4932500.1 hypothetical protein JHK87_046502 [Glycine soja]KAG4929746.1 hypothetical protein JHK86_046707 [Glycine max]KAG4942625.1 hypothetical protein JHK85_047271 [Glycine max]KAG5096961.1 hypothetical protein JHK82_046815 [Glycine max]